MIAGEEHGRAPEAIRAQLQRILASRDFEASERNRRFLEYVVEEALACRAERIKAYCVATAVFGRDDSFDPQMDPIVRIEASRLRRALERYYLTAGRDDPIRIAIPKGSYAPAFSAAGPTATVADADGVPAGAGEPPPARSDSTRRWTWVKAGGAAFAGLAAVWQAAAWLGGLPPFANPAAEAPAGRHGPAIFVAAFEEEGDPPAFPNFTRGFTRELIVGLTRFNDLFVFGPETTFRHGKQGDLAQAIADLGVDFVLTGGTTVSGDHFAVDALLTDAKTGRYIWAASFEGALGTESILAARDDVANQVARSLAQLYGVIFTNRVTESEGKPPRSLTSYDCVIRFYLYWKTYRRESYHPVRTCLEQAIVTDPDYAEAFAVLSLIHSDGYRFGFDDGAVAADPRPQALELARRAIALAPNATRGYHALSLAYWLTNDVEQSLDAARTGLALNPNDTELMADLGMRYAWRNQWEQGLPLLREAIARNPGQPSGYRLALFLDHYVNGRYAEALAEATKIDTPHLVYGHAALAMAAAQLGLTREAEVAVGRILMIDPAYGEHVVEDLEKRNIHPDLIPVVVEGLHKAGLPVPEKVIPAKS
jgi:TolB-like protein